MAFECSEDQPAAIHKRASGAARPVQNFETEVVLTQAARRARDIGRLRRVWSAGELGAAGVSVATVRANLAADRWQRCGRAIVLHSGPLTRHERWRAALVNTGPRSVLTAFTAVEFAGLVGWERPEIHVLGPPGAVPVSPAHLPLRLHRTSAWPVATWRRYRCQALEGAVLLAAASFTSPRPACGILAAAVQQRIVAITALLAALTASSRLRHRAVLVSAAYDILGGAQALSEIDFVRVCRRARLPTPEQQRVRRDGSGRRRYLDASWRLPDGRLLVAEVDGALHLSPRRWWDDQLRQNELVVSGAVVLRFPTAVVRTQPELVVAQLRRAGLGDLHSR
jgi:hypothetical protein